jgi:DNA-directed RNA polymerase specialized sigma subunit
MIRKQHAAAQGIVASENLDTIYQREIFFPVDPSTLDWIDADDLANAHPSGSYLELQLEGLVKYLPEIEAEIFWLIYEKKKHQKDVAKLLGLSQPTVSYRFRRVLTKLSYLMTISEMPIRKTLADLTFLKEHEQDILHDLFFYLNQELVGQKHHVRQSTVKWVFTKTRKQLARLERVDPERWFKQTVLLILLDQFFNIRVRY